MGRVLLLLVAYVVVLFVLFWAIWWLAEWLWTNVPADYRDPEGRVCGVEWEQRVLHCRR